MQLLKDKARVAHTPFRGMQLATFTQIQLNTLEKKTDVPRVFYAWLGAGGTVGQ